MGGREGGGGMFEQVVQIRRVTGLISLLFHKNIHCDPLLELSH